MGRGGAIRLSSAVSVIEISVFDSNNVILASGNSNVEESGGGALAMEMSTVTISRSYFTNNAAMGGGLGGAIRSIFSKFYCYACDFTKNRCGWYRQPANESKTICIALYAVYFA